MNTVQMLALALRRLRPHPTRTQTQSITQTRKLKLSPFKQSTGHANTNTARGTREAQPGARDGGQKSQKAVLLVLFPSNTPVTCVVNSSLRPLMPLGGLLPCPLL